MPVCYCIGGSANVIWPPSTSTVSLSPRSYPSASSVSVAPELSQSTGALLVVAVNLHYLLLSS